MAEYKNDELAALAVNENYETVNRSQATVLHFGRFNSTNRFHGILVATQCASGKMRISIKMPGCEDVEIVSSTGEVNESIFKLTIH